MSADNKWHGSEISPQHYICFHYILFATRSSSQMLSGEVNFLLILESTAILLLE
jgi:hypothetical protein